MFFIPSALISAITFPGVIVHELAHQLFCRWTNTAVFDVVYFQFISPNGYVEHEPPSTVKKDFLITFGPFIINTILGLIISFPAVLSTYFIKFEEASILNMILIWLGISIVMHAFPSRQDLKSYIGSLKAPKTSLLDKLYGYPLVGLAFIGTFGSIVWLDLFFSIFIVYNLPGIIIKLFA